MFWLTKICQPPDDSSWMKQAVPICVENFSPPFCDYTVLVDLPNIVGQIGQVELRTSAHVFLKYRRLRNLIGLI
jgi:hypothetical protein